MVTAGTTHLDTVVNSPSDSNTKHIFFTTSG